MSEALSEQSLTPIYGVERTKAIKAYLKEFEQYSSNFAAQVPMLREAGGRRLLLLQCPLAVQVPNVGLLGVTVGLLFTTQFPEHPPHCAILLQAGERLVQPNPVVAPNGVIRLPQLPFLQGSTNPSLCDILVAIGDAFERNFPVETPMLNRVPPAPQPTSPAPTTQSQTPPPPLAASASTSAASSTAPPPRYGEHLQRAVERPQEKELAEKVLLDLCLRGEEYLRFRKEALEHYSRLRASRSALERQRDSLTERRQLLQTTAPEMTKVAQMVKQWREQNPMPTAASCVVPQDDLHGQALELIAQNHAADDVMELLERKLKKGYMGCDDYLKAVSDVARRQFISRFLLKRAYARISAEASARALSRRFPAYDPQMIAEVLRTSDYDVKLAEARLDQLAS